MRHVDTIRDFVVENFLFGEANGLENSESLIASAVIDSTGVLELVVFIEERFRVRVADEHLVPENLDSIERIDRFVSSLLASEECRVAKPE